MDANQPERKIDDIRRLITRFIEEDITDVLSDIDENYEKIELPQTVKLTIKSGDCDDELVLDEDEFAYIEDECIDEAIDGTPLREFSDFLYVETADKGVDGYYCEGSRQWEKRHYYHFAYASFDVEFNDYLGELTITADCNARFGIEYDGTDEGDEITREEYINGLKALVTDEAAIEALERAMSADDGDD